MSAQQKVLVVDNEAMVTRSCRRILTEAGYDVDTSESGRQGLARALQERFDLVFTDLKMSDLDGMELVRTLRTNRPGTAIVVITGYGTVRTAVEAAKMGVSDYIEKPFTPAEITEAAGRALGTAQKQRQVTVEADLVKEVLRLAPRDNTFAWDLLTKGSRVLSGYALSSEAKAAIVSGDIAWVERECGELTDEERRWLQQRLEAETW
jgi:FixJ family two-component response regulator